MECGEIMSNETKSVPEQKQSGTISSPEQLTKCLKMTSPGIWLILSAVILLIAALAVWSTLGEIETYAHGMASVENGTAKIMITDNSKKDVSAGMPVRIGSGEYSILTVETDDDGRSVAYAFVSEGSGKYEAVIVTDTVRPIEFLFG